MVFPKKRWVALAFVFLMGASAFLHLWRIGAPSQPVFDEAYFSTFAAEDALGEPYLDIHPPLGKFIFSLPLRLYGGDSLKNPGFINVYRSATSGSIVTDYLPSSYKNFPYVDLRLISAFFGLVFLLALFLFVREIAGDYAALLALFFAVFENALLLHSRLVMMDGMYLALGMLGLYFFFRRRTPPILSGILLGLALSVKLTAAALFGPILIAGMLSGSDGEGGTTGRRILKSLATALLTLGAVWFLIDFVILPGKTGFLENFFGWSALSPLLIFPKEVIQSALGYTLASASHPAMSPWYLWPFMFKPIIYDSPAGIALLGNAFVWSLGTAAVIAAILKFIRSGIKRITVGENFKPALLLLGGYVFALLPFVTIIRRATFLYHYFPALVFATALGAFLITKFIEDRPMKTKVAVLVPVIVLTAVGFLTSLPFTYGV